MSRSFRDFLVAKGLAPDEVDRLAAQHAAALAEGGPAHGLGFDPASVEQVEWRRQQLLAEGRAADGAKLEAAAAVAAAVASSRPPAPAPSFHDFLVSRGVPAAEAARHAAEVAAATPDELMSFDDRAEREVAALARALPADPGALYAPLAVAALRYLRPHPARWARARKALRDAGVAARELDKLAKPPVAEVKGIPASPQGLTDLGNARRLVALHGRHLRFCAALGWLAWDGRRWVADEKDVRVNRLAYAIPDAIRAEARASVDPDRRKALEDHADATEGARALRDMVTLARSLPDVLVGVEALDRDPWLLNVQNGTLDLRTGALRPHDPADLLTRLAPVDYDPAARSPLWERFLDEVTVGSLDLGVYLQRIAGYCLTGDATEHCFFLLHGAGRNGKSTFVNVLAAILGDHARNAQFGTFLAQPTDGRIRSDIARLRGARLVSAIESKSGGRLDEGLVKQLTGGDAVTACFKYLSEFEFVPCFKLLLAANERPEIRGTDLGVWSRVKLVPFRASIAVKDARLKDKLLAEAPGILAWAVGGCGAWQREGLAEPEDVRAATEEYRQDEDVLRDFLDDCCLPDANGEVGSSALFRCYTDWCGRQGGRPLRQKTFSLKLENRPGLERVRTRAGSAWRGLQILAMPGSTRDQDNRTRRFADD